MVTSMHAGNPVFMTVEPFTADPDSGTFHQGRKSPVSALGWMVRGCSLRGAALSPSPFFYLTHT